MTNYQNVIKGGLVTENSTAGFIMNRRPFRNAKNGTKVNPICIVNIVSWLNIGLKSLAQTELPKGIVCIRITLKPLYIDTFPETTSKE
jgi:hypothetical protein